MAIFLIIMSVIVGICGILMNQIYDISKIGTVAGAIFTILSITDLTIAIFLLGRYMEIQNKKGSKVVNIIGFLVGVVTIIATIVDLVQWRL